MGRKRAESVPKAQSLPNVNFELHSLGWKAFQDLCTTILRDVLGQTVEHFFDSKDGGRDGAFAGTWRLHKRERFRGTFTVQCKFTAKRDAHLTVADMRDDLAKAERLASRGLATTYILMTNARLTGVNHANIRKAFLSLRGIEHCAIFGQEWLSGTIRDSSRLRMLVPRVYGLGDLSQILDERAYAQAEEILSALGQDLAKFVITDSYRKSAEALSQHGFVLLLGEPACGKSTIAAALAVGSLDRWGCRTLKIRDADEFIRHSNPQESKQFFWIDDAFGATQLDWTATSDWNRAFPHMQAALRRGAKLLFTSRDYIYNAARASLKAPAFPLLAESQVVIHVENLTTAEREQILYNHLRLGTQPMAFRSAIKPYLPRVAAHSNFKPEIARRISDPLFTKQLMLMEHSINDFVARPLDHLCDVIRTLDAGSRSAIAMVFMRGGILASPVKMNVEEKYAVELIGGTAAKVRESLNSLNDSLVLRVHEGGTYRWRFKHATIRDAYAQLIADDIELLDVYLAGSPPERLVDEVCCGTLSIQGAKVVIPEDRFDQMIERLSQLDVAHDDERRRLFRFLAQRCDKDFLSRYISARPLFVDGLRVRSYLAFSADLDLLVALKRLGLLPEAKRASVAARISELAIETPDYGCLDEKYRPLFTNEEFESMVESVRGYIVDSLEETIEAHGDAFVMDDDNDPEDHFYWLQRALSEYRDYFLAEPDVVSCIDACLRQIDGRIEAFQSEKLPPDDEDVVEHVDPLPEVVPVRSVFDDVDK